MAKEHESPETWAEELEKAAKRLSVKRVDSHNIGTDIIVYSNAKLIRAIDYIDRSNKRLTKWLISLTLVLVALTLAMAWSAYRINK